MKRKKILALFLAILMIAPMLTSLTVEAYEVRSPHMYAHSYAVMDANTGKILFGENAKLLTTIFSSIIAVNGVIELIAALVLVPSIYMATHKISKNKI